MHLDMKYARDAPAACTIVKPDAKMAKVLHDRSLASLRTKLIQVFREPLPAFFNPTLRRVKAFPGLKRQPTLLDDPHGRTFDFSPLRLTD